MYANRSIFSLLVLGVVLLSGCATPEQQMAKIKEQGPEQLALNMFGGLCVKEYGNVGILSAKSAESKGLMVSVDPSILKEKIKLDPAQGALAWKIMNPFTAKSYILLSVPNQHCSIWADNLDKDILLSKFSTVVIEEGKMHSNVTPRTNTGFDINAGDVKAYHMKVTGLNIGPILSVVTPHNPSDYSVIAIKYISP